MEANLRKDVIKRIKRALSVILVVVIAVGVCACSNIKTINAEHRLQIWRARIGFNDNEIILASDVKIALIDSGVDTTHPDLKQSVIADYSVEHAKNSTDNEHGTCMAGILSAYPDTVDGVAGVAAKSQLISIDITDNDSAIRIEDLIEGIRYAIDQNADIICICLGIAESSDALHQIIKEAYSKNIVIVASAGNSNSLLYPAAYEEVLAAGMTGSDNKIIDLYHTQKPIVYVPGQSIVTTYSSTDNDSKYYSVTGSSASSAILSGIAALIINQNPDIKNKELYDYLYTLDSNQINIKAILANIR